MVGLVSDFFLQMFFFTTVLSIDIRRMEVRTGWGRGLVPWLALLCERGGTEGSTPWDFHPLKKKGASCKNALGWGLLVTHMQGWGTLRYRNAEVVGQWAGRGRGHRRGWKETGSQTQLGAEGDTRGKLGPSGSGVKVGAET